MTRHSVRSPSRPVVFFAYPISQVQQHKELKTQVERIRHALEKRYKVVQGPSYFEFKRRLRKKDLKYVDDYVRTELESADFVVVYLPTALTSYGVLNEMTIASGLAKPMMVVTPKSVRERLGPFIAAKVRTFSTPAELVKALTREEDRMKTHA